MHTRAEKLKNHTDNTHHNPAAQQKSKTTQRFAHTDKRVEAVAQAKLHLIANNSPQVQHLNSFQNMANNHAQADISSSPIQAMMTSSVVQLERTVTNRMKTNMQNSLARVFGGPATRYQIDQDSGSTFGDGAPNFTTGHHGIKVTDTQDGQQYTCDFHQDGAYYTRG